MHLAAALLHQGACICVIARLWRWVDLRNCGCVCVGARATAASTRAGRRRRALDWDRARRTLRPRGPPPRRLPAARLRRPMPLRSRPARLSARRRARRARGRCARSGKRRTSRWRGAQMGWTASVLETVHWLRRCPPARQRTRTSTLTWSTWRGRTRVAQQTPGAMGSEASL